MYIYTIYLYYPILYIKNRDQQRDNVKYPNILNLKRCVINKIIYFPIPKSFSMSVL